MTYCRRHGRRADICGCSRSYPCLACGGLFPSSDHVCPGERTQPMDSRSDPLAGNPSVVALEAGREPHSKPLVRRTWAEAMEAAHAHVREHHALTSANHTPTWEPCGRGICAAEAGHEGTCEEASGFVDWTPEFYDDDLDAHRDAMDADTLADPIARQILAGETDEDDWIDAPPPFGLDPSTETWRDLLATSREDT